MIQKDTVKAVMECKSISSRMIKIRISANARNISIIQVYAPTADSRDEDIDAFHDSLSSTLEKIPKKTSESSKAGMPKSEQMLMEIRTERSGNLRMEQQMKGEKGC